MKGLDSIIKCIERDGKAREAASSAADYLGLKQTRGLEHDSLDWIELVMTRKGPSAKSLRNLRQNADMRSQSGAWNSERERYAVASDFYVQAATLNTITEDYGRFSANVVQAGLNDWLATGNVEFVDNAAEALDVAVGLLLYKESLKRNETKDHKRGHYGVDKARVKTAFQVMKAKVELYAITGQDNMVQPAIDEAISLLQKHDVSKRYVSRQEEELSGIASTARYEK